MDIARWTICYKHLEIKPRSKSPAITIKHQKPQAIHEKTPHLGQRGLLEGGLPSSTRKFRRGGVYKVHLGLGSLFVLAGTVHHFPVPPGGDSNQLAATCPWVLDWHQVMLNSPQKYLFYQIFS